MTELLNDVANMQGQIKQFFIDYMFYEIRIL